MSIELGHIGINSPALEKLERKPSTPAVGGAQGPNFASELGKAIGKLDEVQKEGDAQAEKLANGAGNLHETSLALEKADITLRLATKVRNKFVETYQEIMRMSV